jgi:hypothetical protein
VELTGPPLKIYFYNFNDFDFQLFHA